MDTIGHFSDLLRKFGTQNYLAIGAVIIILWILILGFRKGLRKGNQPKKPVDHDEHSSEK